MLTSFLTSLLYNVSAKGSDRSVQASRDFLHRSAELMLNGFGRACNPNVNSYLPGFLLIFRHTYLLLVSPAVFQRAAERSGSEGADADAGARHGGW